MLTQDSLREGLPELYTTRTRLRPLNAKDYTELEEMLTDPLVIQYVNRTRRSARERTLRLVAQIKGAAGSLDALHFGIEQRNQEQGLESCLLGITSFQYWNEKKGEAQIGYILNRPYWGSGLATEVVGEMLKFGFHHMGLNRIEGRCHEENIASVRVLLKNHMQYERSIHSYQKTHEIPDVHIYGITREQFESVL